MTSRLYTPPDRVLDKTAPHWNGKTAERLMSRRLKQYAKEKREKMLARRKSMAARRRGR